MRVKMLDTTTCLTGIAKVIVEPVVAGHETFIKWFSIPH